jgi:stage V sporulation protein B
VNSLLEATGDVRAPMKAMLFGCLLKIPVSYFLASVPSVGIICAPLGTVLCYCTALIYSTARLRRREGIFAPLISSSVKPYLSALLSILLILPLHYGLFLKLFGDLGILVTVSLVATFYLIFSIIIGAFGRKEILKLAKYTNFT